MGLLNAMRTKPASFMENCDILRGSVSDVSSSSLLAMYQ